MGAGTRRQTTDGEMSDYIYGHTDSIRFASGKATGNDGVMIKEATCQPSSPLSKRHASRPRRKREALVRTAEVGGLYPFRCRKRAKSHLQLDLPSSNWLLIAVSYLLVYDIQRDNGVFTPHCFALGPFILDKVPHSSRLTSPRAIPSICRQTIHPWLSGKLRLACGEQGTETPCGYCMNPGKRVRASRPISVSPTYVTCLLPTTASAGIWTASNKQRQSQPTFHPKLGSETRTNLGRPRLVLIVPLISNVIS